MATPRALIEFRFGVSCWVDIGYCTNSSQENKTEYLYFSKPEVWTEVLTKWLIRKKSVKELLSER